MAASTLIGALRVTLGLDSAAFEKGADRSIKKMDAVSKAGYLTGRSLRFVADTAISAGAAIAAAFTVQAVKQALDYAASIGEVATQLGVTTDELQVYRYAATQVNLTQEELEKGLAKLTLTIGKAGAGAKREAAYFEKLGIDIKDAEGNIRPTGDVLLDLADRLAAIPDPAQRAAAVFAIFGRQGQKLIPLLEGGSDGLKEFARQAEDAGAVIAAGDIQKADEAADKIDALVQALKTDFSREVAENADAIANIASALASLIGWAAKAGGAYVSFWDKAGAAAGRGLGTIAAYFAHYTGIGKPDKNKAQTPFVRQSITDLLGTTTPMAQDTGDLFGSGGGGGRGGGGGKSMAERIADIREDLAQLKGEIEDAFDVRSLPQATEDADALREKLDEIAKQAAKDGVPVSQFTAELASLRAQIGELELEGLAREAEEFGEKVFDAAEAVDRLDAGAMTPLSRRLADINDRYDSLRESLQQQIEENTALAAVNESAANSMRQLVELLDRLDQAHQNATAAAMQQYAAEEQLRDLMAEQAGMEIQGDITDLRNARGDNGLFTDTQRDMQETERDLQAERIDALIRLRDLQAELDEAQLNGDMGEVTRLQGLIALQEEYYDLVSDTTAEQIVTTQRLQDAYADFTNGLTSMLEDFVTKGEFSFNRLGDLLLSVLNDIFLKPGLDALSGALGGLFQDALGGLFGGMFAEGGTLAAGRWGIVGERGPEMVFSGDQPLNVIPNDVLMGAGRGDTYNINVNGRMNDRDARRTGNQVAAGIARHQAESRKKGLAGS